MRQNFAASNGYAAPEVETEWHLYIGQEVAILKTLREPDIVIANAGNAAVWRAMVETALTDYEGDPSHE